MRYITPKCLEFLAVGTTGVEGLGAEIRHLFSGIVEMHAPILRLKLRIFPLCVLICFFSAVENETTTQIKQAYILRNILSAWEPISTWSDWCQSQDFAYWRKDTKRVVRPQAP